MVPRAAASLVLLREVSDDGQASGPQPPDALEVFMLRRPVEDAVLAGAYVFPGGKVDREDAHVDALVRLRESPDLLQARLAEAGLPPHEAAAVFFAAFRETFEEVGVLLAAGVGQAEADRARDLAGLGLGFAEILERLDLHLDPAQLLPWSRWITPRVPTMMRKRFDTRFFVTAMPAGQQPRPDPREAIGGEWVRPRAALARYWEGSIDLAAPQIMTLAHLSRFASLKAAISEARQRPPPLIEPQDFEIEGGRLLCYPGDERHPVAKRAMPGPTRMIYSDGRFRPEQGFEAWFD